MPLIVFHTRRVRDALKRREAWGADLFFLLLICAIAGGLTNLGKQVGRPFAEKLEISLSLAALPKYTALSLGRGFAAYVLSLIFTLVYGTVAAHNRPAEKLMLPALDVLQAIPVRGFLPGLVLAMVHLFPTREIGLENCLRRHDLHRSGLEHDVQLPRQPLARDFAAAAAKSRRCNAWGGGKRFVCWRFPPR